MKDVIICAIPFVLGLISTLLASRRKNVGVIDAILQAMQQAEDSGVSAEGKYQFAFDFVKKQFPNVNDTFLHDTIEKLIAFSKAVNAKKGGSV